jgi:hypothetical protein
LHLDKPLRPAQAACNFNAWMLGRAFEAFEAFEACLPCHLS